MNDGILPGDMKRLRQLEEENVRLKKLVADPSLDKVILQDVLIKNSNACRAATSRAVSTGTLSSERTQELNGIANQPGMALESANPRPAGLFADENHRNSLYAEAIWVSYYKCICLTKN
jgi:hypothetical protein